MKIKDQGQCQKLSITSSVHRETATYFYQVLVSSFWDFDIRHQNNTCFASIASAQSVIIPVRQLAFYTDGVLRCTMCKFFFREINQCSFGTGSRLLCIHGTACAVQCSADGEFFQSLKASSANCSAYQATGSDMYRLQPYLGGLMQLCCFSRLKLCSRKNYRELNKTNSTKLINRFTDRLVGSISAVCPTLYL